MIEVVCILQFYNFTVVSVINSFRDESRQRFVPLCLCQIGNPTFVPSVDTQSQWPRKLSSPPFPRSSLSMVQNPIHAATSQTAFTPGSDTMVVLTNPQTTRIWDSEPDQTKQVQAEARQPVSRPDEDSGSRSEASDAVGKDDGEVEMKMNQATKTTSLGNRQS